MKEIFRGGEEMALKTEFIGKTYPPVTYPITKDEVVNYADAILDDNPMYRDGTMAPPLFVVRYARELLGQSILDPDLQLNILMLVHGGQEYEFFAPVKFGDKITSQAKIASMYSKQSKSGRNLDFVTVESESKNQNGEPVCKGTWTFIIRG